MPTIDLREHIRAIPDFPKPGILFYDLSTLLAHGPAWSETVHRLADVVSGHKPDLLAGIESRGFLVAAPIAHGSLRLHHGAQEGQAAGGDRGARIRA